MIIKYIGHACFKIQDKETGFSIIFDPYKDGVVPGYASIKDTANMILCSHEHDDHSGVESVVKEKNTNNPYIVQVIKTYHDPERGTLRGENKIHVIINKFTGEKIIHYGDLGEKLEDLLTEENLTLLKNADVVFVPVGNIYTYDAMQALALMGATKPDIMIPMHFRCDELKFGYTNIDSLDIFLDEALAQNKKVYNAETNPYDFSENKFSNCILVMRPENAKQ
ncbi:MAG TPA: MBL fold metallo-hydrolase [Mogibacterium sp.]|nr:MBL fold metallo-hydrolase [Mogibacterium sp.]